MTMDTGRSPDGSGSRASHEAASASSPKASIPNVEDLQRAHREAYDYLTRTTSKLGPDAPETIAAYRAMKVAARAVRNHYIAVSEQAFGRI